ncbi:hypothetical protein ACFSCZ_00140 [Siminovitchia sediminis]|uniref:Uncharacterized protein n=1 Tax=Siminovitchia sediminis TaxID=1274353 RepID=A0ABW4KDK3_9BACI
MDAEMQSVLKNQQLVIRMSTLAGKTVKWVWEPLLENVRHPAPHRLSRVAGVSKKNPMKDFSEV